MFTLFSLLLMTSLFGILLGLIKPGLVLRWGTKRTRGRALVWYGFFAFLCLIGGAVFQEKPPITNQPAPVVTEPAGQPVTQTVPPAQSVDTPEQVEALAKQKAAQTKTELQIVINDLLAADRPGSDASGSARSMLQKVGKGVSLGDVYGAFKAAKLAADESLSRLVQYRMPQDLPKDMHAKLDEAHKAFRSAAMLRSQIATSFMEWLDTRKPSLENVVQEKSNLVTLAMTQAIISLTAAMQAAGLSDDEVKAELAAIGNPVK